MITHARVFMFARARTCRSWRCSQWIYDCNVAWGGGVAPAWPGVGSLRDRVGRFGLRAVKLRLFLGGFIKGPTATVNGSCLNDDRENMTTTGGTVLVMGGTRQVKWWFCWQQRVRNEWGLGDWGDVKKNEMK